VHRSFIAPPIVIKPMEGYKEIATTIIDSLGGNEQVKQMLIRDRREFLCTTLPDALSKCYPVAPVPDKDTAYCHIIEVIKSEGKPDIRQKLLDMKAQCEGMIDSIDNLLFYNG
jgi:hypothetical protein